MVRPFDAERPDPCLREPIPAIFWAFLKLGLTSFGGPIAHLSYFRSEFVERRRWLDDRAFADLVALCQFLPGPASSQAGFAIGLAKAGLIGGLAAFTAFTVPSAILMMSAAYGAGALGGPVASGAVYGLKLVAVAVVAQAVWGMARTLAPDRVRSLVAVGALAAAALGGSGAAQLGAILGGALIGLVSCRPASQPPPEQLPHRVPRSMAWSALVLFVALLLGLPALGALTGARSVDVANAFFQSGALVFGGGHVVLPLLHDQIVERGWVSPEQFLAGYALAQALPGPLFTFAAYLGALLNPGPDGLAGGLLGLTAVFLPGLLLLIGVFPFWNAPRSRRPAQAAMQGANAAVVGVLAAALYDPVWITAVRQPLDVVIAAACFVGLTVWRIAPIWIVTAGAGGGALLFR